MVRNSLQNCIQFKPSHQEHRKVSLRRMHLPHLSFDLSQSLNEQQLSSKLSKLPLRAGLVSQRVANDVID